MRALGLLLRHMWSGDRIAIVGDESYAVLPGFGRECDVYDEMYEPDPDDGDLPPVSPRRWVHITHEVQQLVGPWVKP
jgi:hypothetical protein